MMEQLLTEFSFCGEGMLKSGARLPEDAVLRGILEGIPSRPDGEFTEIAVRRDTALPEDSFSVTAESGRIQIEAANRRAELYAVNALLQQSQWRTDGALPRGRFACRPRCPFRGLKLYLPAPDRLGEFRRMVDLLCYYRYNTLILEVGGAMEYRRHPEINAAWVDYCRDMASAPGRANEVQNAFPWEKNSIHFENGGGRFLSQDTVRELLGYCRERGLEVIPEVPCLSHADYLLLPHPELAERPEDPYPDTYCPSNPASYHLLFEVMDEVIEVFDPSVMHIGHDEYYSIGVCPRCRGRSGAEIYAGDVNRICGYLREKGIRPMLWAEKLLNAAVNNEVAYGGAELYARAEDGSTELRRPATWEAVGQMPPDLLALHWYWGIREDFDNDFRRHGIPFVYGNFNSIAFPDWNRRLEAGALGGAPSHWSSLEEDTLQRNGVLLSLVYGACLFWGRDYRENRYPELLAACFRELYLYRSRAVLAGPHLEFVHTTTILRPYVYLSSVPMQLEKDTVGHYRVEYGDGSVTEIPIIYGKNITNRDRFWDRGLRMKIEGHRGVGDSMEGFDSYTYDTLLAEVSYTTLPEQREDGTYFRFVAPDPYPEKRIVSVEAVKSCPDEGSLILHSFAARG